MKKILITLLCLLMCFSFVGCSSSESGTDDTDDTDDTLAGTYDITIWVSETDGVAELTQQQIDRFMEENEGIIINATIEGITEADSATQMITDVESGADIFCFAQDQLSRLVQAGALSVLGDATAATITEANDSGSVSAVTIDGSLYAYPLTSDNGYFMYYDKSVISDDIVDSLEDIIAACEENNKLFSMELETSAWYMASFFFATGCVSDWVAESDGTFSSVNDTFNSADGIIACKGMQELLTSSAYYSSSNGSDFASGSAVVITGTWASSTIESILGDNMGVADLPSFTVDGETYHLGSYSGYKLMGVKPQTDSKKAAVCQQLAIYLTNEECQLERFEQFGWGPSNVAAQASDSVLANEPLTALAEQNAYATPQGQIHGSWWDIATNIAVEAKTATTDEELQSALDTYTSAINALFSLDGYIFVGAWNDWDNADTSYQLEQNNETYTITLDVPESDYMGGRIVAAGDWGTLYGYAQVTEGTEYLAEVDEADNGDNNIIFAEAGNYTITWYSAANEITIVKN